MSEVFPQLTSWKNCITVACGIPLTSMRKRELRFCLMIAALKPKGLQKDMEPEWKDRVLSYFSFALKSL